MNLFQKNNAKECKCILVVGPLAKHKVNNEPIVTSHDDLGVKHQ